jgi:LuxR family transcriptional regulator, maltose regulon positive regulatory protein
MATRRDAPSVPALSPRHVRRPRLTRILDEAVGQAIVLTAPAGYGKTALAAEWLAGKRAAWYRASPAGADLAAFSVGLAEAAEAVVPGAGERLRQRARVDEAPERAVRPLAELFAEDVATWPNEAWLAVDDYHVVAESDAVEEFVDWVLALAPVRLLVTARRRPRWVTARRALYGEITELTRDELAMTRDEARSVLEGRSGEAVAALVEQAQGWPALIGLAGLSASFALPTARISEALFRYFAEEVLRSEPADVQRFMLAASVPLAIDARTAFDVLAVPDADGAIARLEEMGLLHPAGPDARRFHPLLRDFLRARLTETDPEAAATLGARALADARRARRWDDAFELALEHGRLDEAAEVLADAAPGLLAAGRVETVERWLAECGEAALARPAVAVARAEVLIRRGRLFEALELAEALARRLPADDLHASAAWYLAGRGFHLLSRDEEALACHLRACDTAKTRADRVNALWGATVLAAQLESDVIHRLVAELEDVASDDVDARLQLASGRAFLASSNGSLAGVWSTFEPLLHLAEHASDPMAANSFLIAAAYVSLSRADYALADDLADRAVALCERFRLGPMKLAFSLCPRAAAEIGLRRFPDAARTLHAIDGLDIGRTRILVWERTTLQLKLLLARSRLAEVCDASTPPSDGSGTRSSVGEHAGVVALAAAALGDATRARSEVRRARETTRSVEAAFYARFAEVVLALREGPADAGTALAEAVEAEMEDAFVLAYRAYPPLLAAAAADPAVADTVAAVVRRANDHALARRAGLEVVEEDGRAAALGELTPRESEVLRLMAEGLGNAEISRRLVISEKTTKVHIHHIFQKLGVTTRVQAVLASRRLFEPAEH